MKSFSVGRLFRLTILALAAATAPAAAEPGCVWSDLNPDDAGVAVVQSSAPRSYFVKDDVLQRSCPNDSAACKDRAYLTPGDVVLTGKALGRYTCAEFVGGKGATTVGWMATAALVPVDPRDRAPSDWNGHWVAPEQDLVIAPAGGDRVSVKGEATWGMGDRDRVRRGGIHTGEVTGTTRPIDGALAFTMGEDGKTLPYEAADEFTCRVRLVRRGPYLVVRDNNACGGANVSFSGVYRRKS